MDAFPNARKKLAALRTLLVEDLPEILLHRLELEQLEEAEDEVGLVTPVKQSSLNIRCGTR